MPNDKLKQFYETIKANPNIEGLPDSYEKFEQGLQNEKNAQGFYEALRQSEFIEGMPDNYETFSTALGLKKKETSDPILQNTQGSSPTGSTLPKTATSRTEINPTNEPVMVQPKKEAKPKLPPLTMGKIDIEQKAASTATTGGRVEKSIVKPIETAEELQTSLNKGERIVDTWDVEDLKEKQLDQYVPQRSSAYNIKSLVAKASEPMTATASVEAAQVEEAMRALEDDYIQFLDRTNPEASEYYQNQIEGILQKKRSGKELGESEEKALVDFRLRAIDTNDAAQRLKIKEVKLSSDLDGYAKRSTPIIGNIFAVDKEILSLGINTNGQNPPDKVQKATALIEQRNALVGQLEQLKQETGVTDEKLQQYETAFQSMIGSEAMDYSVGRNTTVLEAKKKEDEMLRANLQSVLSGEQGIVEVATKGFVASVGEAAISAAMKFPKVIGDALGDDDYDAIDEMYYAGDALINQRMGRFANIENLAEDMGVELPASYVYARMFGEGIGSIAMLTMPSNLLGVTSKVGQTAVLGATAFATSEASFYEEALAQGMNPKEAARSATASAATTMVIEMLVRDNKLFDPISFTKSAAKEIAENGYKAGMRQAIQNLGLRTTDMVLNGLKEGGEEVIGQIGESTVKEIINSLDVNAEEYQTFTPKSFTQAFLGGFIPAAGLRVFARPSSKPRSPFQEAVLMDAVTYDTAPEGTAVDVSESASEASKVIADAKVIKDGLEASPAYNALPNNLKARVLSELQRKKLLEQSQKSIGIEDKSLTTAIAEIDAEVTGILETGQSSYDFVTEEEQVKRDEEAPVLRAKREEKGVTVDLFSDAPVLVTATIERVENNDAVDRVAIKETIDYLAKKHGELEALKSNPTRLYSRAEISEMQAKLEADAEMISQYTNEPVDIVGQEQVVAEAEVVAEPTLTAPQVDTPPFAVNFQEVVKEEPVQSPAPIETPISLEPSPMVETPVGENVEAVAAVEEAPVESPVNLEKNRTNEVVKKQKTINESVFIHETDAENIDFFDLNQSMKNTEASWLGKGVYFQEEGTFKVEKYGKNKIKVSISPDAKVFEVKNTPDGQYRNNFVEWAIQNTEIGKRKLKQVQEDGLSIKNILPRDILGKSNEAVDKLKEQGYDALYQDGELVVYNTDVINIKNKNTKSKEAPKVLEGKEAAKAKVDEVAEKIKAALKAKGIDDKNIQKLGVDTDKVVDTVASGVKIMIDAGFAVAEAVEYVLDSVRGTVSDKEFEEVRSRTEANFKEELDEVVITKDKPSDIYYTGRGKKYEDLKNTKGEFLFFSKNPKVSEWYGGEDENVTQARLDTSNFLDLTSQKKKTEFVKAYFTDKDIAEMYKEEIKNEQSRDVFGKKTTESLIEKYRERAQENRFSADGKEQMFLLKKIKEQGYSGVKLLDIFFDNFDISYVVIDKSVIDQSVKVEEPVKEEPKQEKKEAKQEEFTEAAKESKGEKRTRGFAERAKEAGFGDVINPEYDSTDRELANVNAQKLFDKARSMYESGDTSVFDRIQETFLLVTLKELAELPQLGAIYANFFHKTAFYFNLKGQTEKAGQFLNLQAEVGTAAGTYASALSAESTPEAIANRLFKEDKERAKILQTTTRDGQTVKEVLKGLKESGNLSKEDINDIVSVLDVKVRRTATTNAEKKEELRKKRQEIKQRISKKMGLTMMGPLHAIPEIIELADTYIEQGVITLSDLKNKVWSEVKDIIKGTKEEVDKVIDDNAERFAEKIDANNQEKAVKDLTRAFEGKALEGDALRKKAITIISDMMLRNDPEYVAKKDAKVRLKAKERLAKILKNRDAITNMVVKAKEAAIATVNNNEKLSPAEKQTMINAIEDVASGLIGMPVGMSNQRAASQSLNDEEVKAEIDRIVRDHYENPSGEIKTLAQKLVEQLGIDPAYAEQLQKQVEDKVAKKVKDKLESRKKAIDKAIESLGVKNNTSFKKAIVSSIAKGRTTDKQFFGELLTAMGVRGFSQEDAAKLKDYIARLSVLDPSNELYTEISKYMNDIALKYDETTLAFIGRAMQELFFINALSDFINTGIFNSGIGATLAFAGSSIQHLTRNPRRYARALKYNRILRKNGCTVGAASLGEKMSNPMKNLGETTFVDKVTEAGHGAVQRATESSLRDLLRKFQNNENNQRGKYLAMMVTKVFSHMMSAGKWPNFFRKLPYVKRATEIIPPPTMWATALMSGQDLFMGTIAANIETYIQTERYIEELNKERVKQGLSPLVRGTEDWNKQLQELLPHSPEAIATVKKQVEEEMIALINAGERVDKGWAERRRRSLLRQKLPSVVVEEAAHNALKALTLSNPEGVGAYVVAIKNKYGQIKDTDNLMAIGKLVGNVALGFIRMTTLAVELSYRALPVIGASSAIYGKKARIDKGRVVWVDMSTEEKITRYQQNAIFSLIFTSLAMMIFDWEEEDELDAKGNPTGNKIMRLRIAADSPIQFYGDPVSEKERNKMEGMGIAPNSVSIFGKNIPLKFLGFQMAMLGKMLGEVSDNVRYNDPTTTVSMDGKVVRTNDAYWTPDMLAGLITAQAFSADYSTPVKATNLFSRGQWISGAETLMLDGLETSFSPSLYENIRTEIQALQGLQSTAKDDITDRILGDIFWTDLLIDKTDRKLYDHFGQPIPIKPKMYAVKALIGEEMYAEGGDHVKNSKYYKLFNEENKNRDPKDQWTPPQPYDPSQIFKSGHVPDEAFAQEITRRIGQAWASYIDEYYDDLKKLPFEKRVNALTAMRYAALNETKAWAIEIDKNTLPPSVGAYIYDPNVTKEEIEQMQEGIGTR